MNRLGSEFGRILVVEDDPISYEVLADVLRRVGYQNVQRAEDGASAISRIAKFQPNLIITDFLMAPVHGLELLGLIRTGKYGLPADLPVIVYTSSPDKRLVTQCIALDVNGFIVKPISVDAVRRRLAEVRMDRVVTRSSDYYDAVIAGLAAGMTDSVPLSAMRLMAPASATYQGDSGKENLGPLETGKGSAYLNWSDKYSVHDSAMDSDHRGIIDLINEAFLVHSGASEPGTLSRLASKLYQYTVDHFAAEETLLRRVAYPKLVEHLKLHKSMTEQTHAIRLRIEALDADIERDAFQFLKEWWLTHIQTTDKAYGDYLQEISGGKSASKSDA